ncbi:uncharacterized protein LOC116977352 [Amblyraja radiata]|uniref:uncharacterized protein LOC116977352 n=1 Tax=Amblyraja radiata TaxID=386614 RepID=UPI001403210E|nr:uncharacterized protein LOC116977352 [Amblyraja radiata]
MKRGKESRPRSDRSAAFTPLWQEAAPRRPTARRQTTRTVSSTLSPKATGFHLFPAGKYTPESEDSSDSSSQSSSSSASSETMFGSYLDILKILCRCQQRSKGKWSFGYAGQEFRPKVLTHSPGSLYSPLGTANILGESPEVSDEEMPPSSPAGPGGSLLTLKLGQNVGEDAACLGLEGEEQGEDHPLANLFTKGRAGPQMARPNKEELGSFSLVYRKHVKSQGKEEQTRRNSIQVRPYGIVTP